MRSQDGNAANAARALGAVAWITGRDRLGFGFSGGSDGKEPTCNAGDLGSVPGFGRSPVGGDGNPLKYSCLENLNGQNSLAGCSPWDHKELDTTE